MVCAGALLLFTAGYLKYPEIGLGAGFALSMGGIYRISLRTGNSLSELSEKNSDDEV